ncbi:MAG: universal stress protein [Proteobacteria bacterium]|nr:universal stress protein [Pseudomonadota bacterium]
MLQIGSYPDPTPVAAIDAAVRFTKPLGARLSALAVQVRIPVRSNSVLARLMGVGEIVRDEEAKSLAACRAALDHFARATREAGIEAEGLIEEEVLEGVAGHIARRARTRDLCLVPLCPVLDGQPAIVESVIFGAGRPVIVFGTDTAILPGEGALAVTLAWDGSRSAARAMADALPVLKLARQVRVATVGGDKRDPGPRSTEDLLRHLKLHGIDAAHDRIEAEAGSTGAALDEHARAHGSTLLVMGAYGHSRTQEFILGGVTAHMLQNPKTALLLSH